MILLQLNKEKRSAALLCLCYVTGIRKSQRLEIKLCIFHLTIFHFKTKINDLKKLDVLMASCHHYLN